MVEITVTGEAEVMAAISRLMDNIQTRATRNIQKAADFLERKVRDNVSLTDHSLAELAAMGHPYARRAPRPPHSPSWLVHKQSGRMVEALEQDNVSEKFGEIVTQVGFDESKAPHAAAVLFGTKKMISRDVLTGTATQHKSAIYELLVKDIDGSLI